MTNRDWWPNQPNLQPLRQPSSRSDPMGADFNYAEPQLFQDPVPAVDHDLIAEEDIAALKGKVLASGLSVPQLVSTAWAAAASFRGTDKRGGANGARIRLAPQKDWEVNNPAELATVLQILEQVQQDFNGTQSGGRRSRSRT